MSETDQFWEYAKEATLSACYAQTARTSRVCLSLREVWTQAALQERASTDNNDTATKAIAA